MPLPSDTSGVKHLGASLPDALLLAEAPTGAKHVAELKTSAKDGDQIVIRVIVGGREKPMVDNRAIMTVVDAGMHNQCMTSDHACVTPWDYCCASPEQLKLHLATLRIVDDEGRPLVIDLTTASDVRPLAVLVVKGTVGPRPDPGAFIVDASGIFVESTP